MIMMISSHGLHRKCFYTLFSFFFRAKRGKHFLHIISLYLSARSAETFFYTLFSFIFPREAWKMFFNPLYSFIFPREARENFFTPYLPVFFRAKREKHVLHPIFFVFFRAKRGKKVITRHQCSRSRREFAGKKIVVYRPECLYVDVNMLM